nr:thioredoxin family protein [Bacteroidota bacterium]
MNSETISLESLRKFISDNKAVMVYFYSDRCAPCVSLRPKISNMVSGAFPEMGLVFLNSEISPEITGDFGIFTNPAIVVFFEGKEFRRYSKYISINELGGDIERIYQMVFGE